MRWFASISIALILAATGAHALQRRTSPAADTAKTAYTPPRDVRSGASVRSVRNPPKKGSLPIGRLARASARPIDPSNSAGHQAIAGRTLPRETLSAVRSRWPVHGPITSDFGERRSFWRKRFHSGIDIGVRHGTPVRAPAAGTVAFAGWRSGYGRTIMIDHGQESSSLYGHLSKVDVRRGQRVEPGAIIGSTGATGRASGPHLHYELLVNGRPVSPRGAASRSADSSSVDRERRGKNAEKGARS